MRLLLAVAVGLVLASPASAAPRCLGAASRDAAKPCDNPALEHRVTPTPDQALLTPNLACVGGIADCSYGKAGAPTTVAVLGDSHAAHWRGAMGVVADALDWHVQEFAPPHCSFSAATPDAGPEVAASCPQYRQGTIDYLTAHPEIQTVFVSAHTRSAIKTGGAPVFPARVQGFLDEWAKLPASVTQIIVLRDDPEDRVGTFNCVRRAIRAGANAGRACRVKRSFALARDAEVTAAAQTPRTASVIDLTHQFCSARWCFPVVGGVLVHKDQDHLGQLFAQSLGPILLRQVRAIL